MLQFITGVGVDPVMGTNWNMTLRNGTDTVAVGDISVPNVSIFLIEDQSPPFEPDPFDGIQGACDPPAVLASISIGICRAICRRLWSIRRND